MTKNERVGGREQKLTFWPMQFNTWRNVSGNEEAEVSLKGTKTKPCQKGFSEEIPEIL